MLSTLGLVSFCTPLIWFQFQKQKYKIEVLVGKKESYSKNAKLCSTKSSDHNMCTSKF